MNPEKLLILLVIFPLIGSFIGFILGIKSEKYRDVFNIIMTGITLIIAILLYKYVKIGVVKISVPYVMGVGLYLKLNIFRYIFVFITCFVWFLTTIYSTQYLISYKNRNRYYLFFMLTLWSTIGIFISENFLNLFTFFEIMSLTSYALVIHDEDDYAHDAGDTYIVMAVSGGLILLMGLFLLYDYTKTLNISDLQYAVANIGNMKYVIYVLIIIGFGVKAGMVPLHIWLPKAHPAAPAPASAILSGILLKSGIFGIIVTTEVLVKGDLIVAVIIMILGFINMLLGGFLAMFQRNIKRILAYSSMSQIGYILVGIGLMGMLKDHRAVAIYGTLYHVINHAIFKVLLFMAAGTVYMVLHELSINKIGGFGRDKKALKVVFLIGLLAIIGMPGFNGFASKTLLHIALSEAHHMYGSSWFIVAEVLFTISSSFTVAYLLKIFVGVFVEESDNNFENAKARITKRSILPMAVLSIAIICIGIWPNKILNVLNSSLGTFNVSGDTNINFYTLKNIGSSIVTIAIGAVIYIGFIRICLKKGKGKNWWYENTALNWFSLEKNFYKPLGKVLFHFISVVLKVIDNSVINIAKSLRNGFGFIGSMPIRYKRHVKNTIENNFKENPFDESIHNVKEEVGQVSQMLNSVTYSIFIFGIVLVVCLAVMMKF